MTTLSKQMTRGLLAADFTVDQITAPGFSFTIGDKTFSDFVVTGSSVESVDVVSIQFLSGNYQVNYRSNPGLTVLNTSGTLSYKVSIGSGFTNTFLAAGTDAQGYPLIGQDFTKTLAATGLSTLVFNSPPGTAVDGFFAPGLKTIDVTSSWSFGTPGSLGPSFIVSSSYFSIY